MHILQKSENMSDRLEDDLRPAKRARLDDSTAPTLAPETSVQAPQNTSTATKPTSTNAIDEDLEREVRAGIIEYVCPDNLGFTGVLKQRYTDFLVNEIGLDGQVLHLTGTEVPKKEDKTNGAIKENTKPKEEKVETLLLQEDSGDAVMVDVQPEAPREEAVAKDQSSEARPEIGEATETKQEPEEEVI